MQLKGIDRTSRKQPFSSRAWRHSWKLQKMVKPEQSWAIIEVLGRFLCHRWDFPMFVCLFLVMIFHTLYSGELCEVIVISCLPDSIKDCMLFSFLIGIPVPAVFWWLALGGSGCCAWSILQPILRNFTFPEIDVHVLFQASNGSAQLPETVTWLTQ